MRTTGDGEATRLDVEGVVVIALRGEHDVFTAPRIRSEVIEAVQAGRPTVVDLTDVTFVDSSIMAVLLGGLRRAREEGIEFAIVLDERVEAVWRMFDVTGLLPIFPRYPDRARAVDAVRASGASGGGG